MASVFQFHCLGSFVIEREGVPLVDSLGLQDKTLAMIAYLACCSTPQARQSLAHLFCSEAKNQSASLRWQISRIRKALGADFFAASEHRSLSIEWPRSEGDVSQFEALFAGELSVLSDDVLDRGLALYRGEFLQGFQIKHAPHFDIWLAGERSRLGLLYEKAMQLRIQRFLASYAHEDAMAYAQKLLEIDPLREDLHSLLMWLYAKQGQRDAAIQQYHLCQQLLKQQLDVPLLEETEDLYQQIVEGDFAPTHDSWLPDASIGASEAIGISGDDNGTMWVGREAELQQLREGWRDVTDGHARCLLIEGEAGAGKTTLVQRWLSAHHDDGLYAAASYASTQHHPYHLWRQVLEPMLATWSEKQLEGLPPFVAVPLSRLLPQLLGHWSEQLSTRVPQDEPGQLLAAIRYILAQVAEAPLLLWFDDVHWCDTASLQLLLGWLRSSPMRVMVVLGRQPQAATITPQMASCFAELQQLSVARRCPLPDFQEAELQQLVVQIHPDIASELQSSLARRLKQETGGNAFFVHELLHASEASQLLASLESKSLQTGDAKLFIPNSIKESLQLTFAQLSSAQKQVLEVLAIFAQPTPWVTLALACHQQDAAILDALEWGMQRRLLTHSEQQGQGHFGFRQSIVQRAIQEGLSPIRRQLLHKQIGEALRQVGATPAVLAYHWRGASMVEQEADASERAAYDALACYAYDEAIHYLRRCVALSSDKERALSFERQIGEIQQLVGQWERAEETFLSVLSTARRLRLPHQMARSALVLGQFALAKSELPRAEQWLLQAKDVFVQQEDLEGAYLSWRHLASVYRQMGDLGRAMAAHESQGTLAEALGDGAYQVESSSALSGLYAQMGKTEQALSHFEATLQMATEGAQRLLLDDLDAPAGHEALARKDGLLTISKIMDRAALSAPEDHYMEALSQVEQQLRFHSDSGQMARVHRGWEQLSTWYALLGDLGNSMRFAQQLFALAARQFSFPGLSDAAGNLGVLYQRCGALAEARLCYAYKLSIAIDLREKRGLANALRHLAELCWWHERDANDAETCVGLALRLCLREGFGLDALACLQLRAMLLRAQGHKDAADAWEEANAHARQLGMDDVDVKAFEESWLPAESTPLETDIPTLPMQIQQFHHTLEQQLQRIRTSFPDIV